MLSFLLLPVLFQSPADLVIENARIWSDGAFVGSWAAVRDGRFVEVGKEDPSLIGPSTKRLNANGRIVMPGFIDSHSHLLEAGVDLSRLNLRPAKSKEEFIAMVKNAAAKLRPGQWLQGSGWSVDSYPTKEIPSREWLDRVTGDHPTLLVRMDGHSCVANSLALKSFGITKDGPPNPTGGIIDRDSNGEPTGMLRDNAMHFVKTPPETAQAFADGLRAAAKVANSFGVTAVSDIASPDIMHFYAEYARKNPTLRFGIFCRAGDTDAGCDQALQALKSFPAREGWSMPKGIKLFADGSIGSKTAWMKAPFVSPPPGQSADYCGSPRPGMLDGTYARDIRKTAEAGFQVATHAIGDRANAEILNLYEANAPRLAKRRFRVEHAQHLAPEDLSRFGKLGVIPSMQPFHKADDGRYVERTIGATRCATSYAYHSLQGSGALLAFGSDWPVVTNNPIAGVETAVTGRIQTGKIWHPEQDIDVNSAFRAYTTNGAYAMFEEKELGKIAPGFLADFVVLRGDPFAQVVDWSKVQVAATYVGGRQAYSEP